MPCDHVKLPGGGYAIVCSRGRRPKRCSSCGRASSKLCDYPLRGEKAGKTCDLPICDACATHVPPDTDYCPPHARLMAAEANRP